MSDLADEYQMKAARVVARVRNILPEGIPLPADQWMRRHTVVVALVWSHVLIIPAYAVARGYGLAHGLLEATPILAGSIVSILPRFSKGVRQVASTLGLMAASGILVHLSKGLIEMHFHYFVMVMLITLYQSWTPLLMAIGFVALQHGVVGAISPHDVYNHAAAISAPWRWAGVHAFFILGASAVGIANWKMNELARARAESYYRRLYEGERGLVKRLEEAEKVKEELVSIVSHEFRTPLTGIKGFAMTLRTHGESIESANRTEMVDAILRQTGKLEFLVNNLLETSRTTVPAGEGVVNVAELAQELFQDWPQYVDQRSVTLLTLVDPDLWIGMEPDRLEVVLRNLLVNAKKFAPLDTTVGFKANRSDNNVVIQITNVAEDLEDLDLEKIFEPFVQLDSSNTRIAPGVGLGLHIVRRIVGAHGGTVCAESVKGTITFKVVLPAVDHPSNDNMPKSRETASA